MHLILVSSQVLDHWTTNGQGLMLLSPYFISIYMCIVHRLTMGAMYYKVIPGLKPINGEMYLATFELCTCTINVHLICIQVLAASKPWIYSFVN